MEEDLLHANYPSNLSNDELATPVKNDKSDIEIGMDFPSKEAIYNLYNAYAFKMGFGIRKRNSRPNYIMYQCNRGGFTGDPKEDSNIFDGGQCLSSVGRIGCGAALHASKVEGSNLWKVTKFTDEHNHNMVSPSSLKLMRSHKDFSAAAKSLTESFNRAGVPIAKVPFVLGTTSVPFEVKDCYNHIGKIRKVIYEAGDAQGVLMYCNTQHTKDPLFFYSIQFDDDSRMKNFFWIDGRSILAYEKFGDVITFDTTYRTNKYSMPFAPFFGLNHHLQTILLGCALLHDETEETFVWLFQTWLSVMNGKKPNAIITDQDGAIGKAVARVFPETRHRLCIWHIMRKFPEKLSQIYQEHANFKDDITDCIYKARSTDEFDEMWQKMVDTYGIGDHEWLKGLYNIRSKWIPVFNKSCFFAGMSTTQRSESINAFFNGFVNPATTLQEFVVKFEMALDSRFESYKREEYDSVHKERRLTISLPILEHAAKIYTRNVFVKFHAQMTAALLLSKDKISKDGGHTTYRVWNRKDRYDDFMVAIDFITLSVTCNCKKFEFMGILCSHILAIFHAKSIFEIPSQYILQRWCKNGNKLVSTVSPGKPGMCMRTFPFREKYKRLDELVETSEIASKFIYEAIDTIICQVEAMLKNESAEAEEDEIEQFHVNLTEGSLQVTLKDPKTSQTKGRKRIKSGIEKTGKNTNICGTCGVRGHNRRSCKQVRATQ